MGKPKAPKAPDPIATAAGQTATNVSTAVANQVGSQTNQVTPDGRLSYLQSGTYRWNDPSTGQSYEIPQWTATQELSPAQQAIKAQSDGAELNLATLGNQQSGRLNDLLSQPASLDNATTEARLMELGRQRLDPMLREREDASRTRLANMGLGMGSEAYNREMRRVSEAQNDAYNQLLLQGRGQAVQERLTERNQPINEITALLSGSQVSQPNFVNTPGMNMPTTDFAGITQQNYANRANAANQKSQAMGNLFGGLLGAGSNLGAAWILSDRRTKTDIERVGQTDAGLPLYRYRYKDGIDDGRMHIGPMAQEVAAHQPDAAASLGGILAVDLSAVR